MVTIMGGPKHVRLAPRRTSFTLQPSAVRFLADLEIVYAHSWKAATSDVVFQAISSFVSQSVDLSEWQDVQAFGILYFSVIRGRDEFEGVQPAPWDSSICEYDMDEGREDSMSRSKYTKAQMITALKDENTDQGTNTSRPA
jgi:hypothetical protein